MMAVMRERRGGAEVVDGEVASVPSLGKKEKKKDPNRELSMTVTPKKQSKKSMKPQHESLMTANLESGVKARMRLSAISMYTVCNERRKEREEINAIRNKEKEMSAAAMMCVQTWCRHGVAITVE